MAKKIKVAVVQIASHPSNALRKAQSVANQVHLVAKEGARLAVFPGAIIGEAPKEEHFDCRHKMRNTERRETYVKYYVSAIYLNGPEIACISKAAADTGVFVVIGIIERNLGQLYFTALYFDGKKGLVSQHRKPMQMAGENYILEFGDGSFEDVVTTEFGNIGAMMCWQNDMPALRMHMYSQRATFCCTPTVEDSDVWLPTMQFISKDGRRLDPMGCETKGRRVRIEDKMSIDSGASTSNGHTESGMGGPLSCASKDRDISKTEILFAELDTSNSERADFDFDPVVHSSESDGISLMADTKTRG